MGSDNGVAMISHLAKQQANLTTCLEGWMGNEWWAPDQPNYVSGSEDPNFNRCLGFSGVPTSLPCDHMFETAQRVCHCTNSTPAPTPAPTTDTTYTTVVWTYEWPTADQESGAGTSATDDATEGFVVRVLERMGRVGLLSSEEETTALHAALEDINSKPVRVLTALLLTNSSTSAIDVEDIDVPSLRRAADFLRKIL